MENNNISNANAQNGIIEEEEIDLLELALRFWAKRKFIIKIVSVFIVLGLFVAIFSPKEYSASCTVVPQSGEKNMSGSLGGLAAMAGISLGNMGAGETLSPKVYSKVMNNVNLQKELINTVVNFEDIEEPVTLLDYYTNEKYAKPSVMGTIMKYTIGLPGVIIGAIKGEPKENPLLGGNASTLATLTKEELECMKILETKMSLNVNDKEGYVTISANMPEALVAAQVTERIMYLLQKYVTEFKIEKAAANYEFIKQQYNDAWEQYKEKQEEYAKFKDANRSITTALAATKEEQIKNDYNLAYSLYSELAKQKVQAEIKVKEDTPILTVVEPVIVPREKSKPKRSMILIAFTFLGCVAACGTVFAFDFLKKNFDIKYLKDWE